MGETCSVLRTIDRWMSKVISTAADNADVRVDRASGHEKGALVEASIALRCDPEPWRQRFLANAPVLRDLLSGVETERDIFEIICTINRLLFFYVIVRWINGEMYAVMNT